MEGSIAGCHCFRLSIGIGIGIGSGLQGFNARQVGKMVDSAVGDYKMRTIPIELRKTTYLLHSKLTVTIALLRRQDHATGGRGHMARKCLYA